MSNINVSGFQIEKLSDKSFSGVNEQAKTNFHIQHNESGMFEVVVYDPKKSENEGFVFSFESGDLEEAVNNAMNYKLA